MSFDANLYLMENGWLPADASVKAARTAAQQARLALPRDKCGSTNLPDVQKRIDRFWMSPSGRSIMKWYAQTPTQGEALELQLLKLSALRKEKKELIKKRLAHKKLSSLKPFAVPIKALKVPIFTPEFLCPDCHERVLVSPQSTHYATCIGNKRKRAHSLNESFVFLPPGENSVYHALERHFASSPRYNNVERDYSRGNFLDEFKPTERREGKKEFSEYAAYIFENPELVILESPLPNNATYILFGDWEIQARLTKREVREDTSQGARRLIHTDNWKRKIRQLLAP